MGASQPGKERKDLIFLLNYYFLFLFKREEKRKKENPFENLIVKET
jgi:hypothetical protein